MLSKALDRSRSTTSVSFFESMASSILSDITTFSVSVECDFFVPALLLSEAFLVLQVGS